MQRNDTDYYEVKTDI